MRSAKETEYFPYKSKLLCYIEVFPNGEVKQLKSITEKREAFYNARGKRSNVYAVWPGEWRSDLFIIDDLDAWCEGDKLYG